MKFNFAENRTVEDMGAVPANCKPFYEKNEGDEGGFNLRTDAQTTAAVAIITGQVKALVAVRKEVTDAKANKTVDLTALSSYGTTVEEIAANVGTKVEELTANASDKNMDAAKQVAAVKKEHGEATAAAKIVTDKLLATKQGQLENYMLDTAITNAGAGFQNLNTTLVSPFARKSMAIHEVDGEPQVVILGPDKEPRYSTCPERAGLLMNTDELLGEMAEDKTYAPIFPSTQATTGGGAQQTNTPGRKTDTSKMSPSEKIASALPGAMKK
jgi:hypothetical protein